MVEWCAVNPRVFVSRDSFSALAKFENSLSGLNAHRCWSRAFRICFECRRLPFPCAFLELAWPRLLSFFHRQDRESPHPLLGQRVRLRRRKPMTAMRGKVQFGESNALVSQGGEVQHAVFGRHQTILPARKHERGWRIRGNLQFIRQIVDEFLRRVLRQEPRA